MSGLNELAAPTRPFLGARSGWKAGFAREGVLRSGTSTRKSG